MALLLKLLTGAFCRVAIMSTDGGLQTRRVVNAMMKITNSTYFARENKAERFFQNESIKLNTRYKRQYHVENHLKVVFQRRDFCILLLGSRHLLHQVACTGAFHFRTVFVFANILSDILAVHLKGDPYPYAVQALIEHYQCAKYGKCP